MAKNLIILQILLLSGSFVTSEFPQACMQMLDRNLFLYECCEYPVIPPTMAVYDKCTENCSMLDYCCFQECSARESGTYVNGTLNADKMKEIFAIQKSFTKFTSLTDTWKKIVNESVDKCSVIEKSSDQKLCEYIYEIMACLFRENYLNCPIMKDQHECLEVKTEMEECSKTNGSWRFITDAFNMMRPRTYAKRYAENSS